MPPPFNLTTAIGTGPSDLPHISELFLRMLLATLLGSFVAYRGWRRFLPSVSPPPLEGAQTQTLVAAAGALMVVVIGDNVARAFGLVGLGSFIRFRSGIRDSRDAAVMFVMIGIGMACGLGLAVMALGGTVFVSLLLFLFDATSQKRAQRSVLTLLTENPVVVSEHLRKLFTNVRVIELGSMGGGSTKDSGRLVVEVDLRGNMDAQALRRLFDENQVPGVSRISLSE